MFKIIFNKEKDDIDIDIFKFYLKKKDYIDIDILKNLF